MPNHLELAEISQQIYAPRGGFVPNWKVSQYFSDNQGLAVGVYEKVSSNETVIAFMGTNTGNLAQFLKNIYTNIQIIFGRVPNTVDTACQYVREMRAQRTILQRIQQLLLAGNPNQLYLTGHSLGGMLAHFVGFEALTKAQKNYYVVSFENPGIERFVDRTILSEHEEQINHCFLTYLTNPNLINTFSPHLGRIKRIPLKLSDHSFFLSQRMTAKNITDCIIHDMFRIIVCLLVINYFLQDEWSSMFLSILFDAAKYLASFLLRGDYFARTTIHSLEQGLQPFLKALVCFIIYNSLSELISQTGEKHALAYSIHQLRMRQGVIKDCDIPSWPNKTQYLLAKTTNLLTWINPLSHKSMLTLTRQDKLEEDAAVAMLNM